MVQSIEGNPPMSVRLVSSVAPVNPQNLSAGLVEELPVELNVLPQLQGRGRCAAVGIDVQKSLHNRHDRARHAGVAGGVGGVGGATLWGQHVQEQVALLRLHLSFHIDMTQ